MNVANSCMILKKMIKTLLVFKEQTQVRVRAATFISDAPQGPHPLRIPIFGKACSPFFCIHLYISVLASE